MFFSIFRATNVAEGNNNTTVKGTDVSTNETREHVTKEKKSSSKTKGGLNAATVGSIFFLLLQCNTNVLYLVE